MSNYAKIENGVVTNIIICEDDLIDSFSGNYIKITNETNEAHKLYEYDASKNKFKAPQPFESWTLDEETLLWEAPVAKPAQEGYYRWDEDTQDWVQVS
jgi:hypothetical protein